MKPVKIITRRDHLNGIPERWRKQYGHGYYAADDEKQNIQKGLDALPMGEFGPDEVERIIGNSSWSDFRCDLCDQNHWVLVRIGDEPDYEARWLDVCRDCLITASAALD